VLFDFKPRQIIFLPYLMVSLPLQHAKGPALEQDIFVQTMTTIDGQTDCFIPCACMWGNNVCDTSWAVLNEWKQTFFADFKGIL
jgi:hypothetical protein